MDGDEDGPAKFIAVIARFGPNMFDALSSSCGAQTCVCQKRDTQQKTTRSFDKAQFWCRN
jgi:hypothetical protein